MIQIIDRSVGNIDVTRIMDGEDEKHRHRAVGLKWTENLVFIYPKAEAWRRKYADPTRSGPLARSARWVVSHCGIEIRAEYSGIYPNWLLTRKRQILAEENARLILSDQDNRELGLAGRILIDQMLKAARRARPGVSVRTLK